VGVLTKSSLMTDRRGLALPSAMFALVAIAVLLAGIFVFADLQAKAVRNRERATRAVHVAEAGMNHALGLLRGSLKSQSFTRLLKGWDNAVGTADDSCSSAGAWLLRTRSRWPARPTRGIPISWRSATTRPMATETQRQT
jgi:type II secretory pathway component PulK